MGSISNAISGRLDLVFFFYGLSFTAMGLLLFVQPKKESSLALASSLWLLGWFGVVHGANEFLDMWDLIARPGSRGSLELAKFSALTASFIFLLEFGRRAAKSLEIEKPAWHTKASWLLGPYLTPFFLSVALLSAALSGDFTRTAPAFSRLLLGFPGALLSGFAFLGYVKCRTNTLVRLKARNYFLAAAAGFLAYAFLGGLVLPEGAVFSPGIFDTAAFQAAVGLPVQLFRALCAILIFSAILGVIRIFREGALKAAQQELLDIIEFFPDATFVIDSEKKVIAWNRALEKMTGVPKAEMLGKGDFAYSVPFYGERRPILIDLIATDDPATKKLYEYVRKRPDGAIYAEVFVPSLYEGKGAHVWVTASPLRDKDGSIYGAIESVRDVTDRKLAEEALHRSEAQYRALIETTNTGFLIIDDHGKVADANQEYVRLTGRKSLAEIHGRSVMEWTAPYDREKNEKAIAECDKNGFIRNFEIDYAGKDGSVIPLELNATVVNIGGSRRILTLCRDITDRRRAEKLLKESEDKFRTLTEKSLTGVYLIQDGLFRYVNPKLTEIFGYRKDELVDKKGPQDLVLPADWPIVAENLRQRMDGEITDVNYAFRGVRKDGTPVMVEVYGSKTEFRGRPAVLGTLLDITERQETQNALSESEERYRTLVDFAPVGIIVHQQGRIQFFNKKMEELGNIRDYDSVIGMSVLDFIHPDYRDLAKKRIALLMEKGVPLSPAEEKLLAPDGTVFDMETQSIPISYQGKSSIMTIVQDISARKKAELELLEANAELERRVEERTAQLEEVNKELEAFSYSAAHDLKAPLRRVNIFAEMLEKEAGPVLTEDTKSHMLSIRKAVTQMTGLVEGLLALSTTSSKPLLLEPVRLSALLNEALAEVKAETAGRAIEWSAMELPELNCDRLMIKQVFINLLSNAAKYSHDRSPARISVSYEKKGSAHIIGVRDNGVGFSMEYYDKLFGVFQRLHKVEDFPGTGIGLSMVKRIISRHGGRVWAESVPDQGAVFYFTLPAK